MDAFVALPHATKTALNTYMRNHLTAQVLKKLPSLIITAGLKTHISRESMTLPQIKDLTIKQEKLLQEKLKKNTQAARKQQRRTQQG